jgi:hypothetical protein
VAGRKRATDEPEVRKSKPRKRAESDSAEPDDDSSNETPPAEPQTT